MRIERVNPSNDEKELERLRLYENRLEQNGITDCFIGLDNSGNLRYVIKHCRTVRGMSTIIVELYSERGIVAIGGGYNVNADVALLKALEKLGLKMDKQEIEKANICSFSMGKDVDWYKHNLETLMNEVMFVLGCKKKIRVYKVTSFARNMNITLTDGFYYK